MELPRFKLFAAGVCLALVAAPVAAQQIYSNDFNTAIGSEWSIDGPGNTLEIETSDWINTGSGVVNDNHTPGNFGDRYLGFGDGLDVGIRNRVVTLTLDGVPQHSGATLSFDLLALGSWDGNEQPDIFGVTVNQGPNLLFSSFANNAGQFQSYPDPYPSLPGYPSATGAFFFHVSGEARYHFVFDFAHSSDELKVHFFGMGLNDEGWGLENVSVSVAPVPLPPALGMFAGALSLLALRRKQEAEKTAA